MRTSCLLLSAACFLAFHAPADAEETRPNFIIIFTDDQGYGDLGCQGSPEIETPHIDQMAAEGIRFTSFYAAPFCGPSRAALMTGCYPPRISCAFNRGPDSTTGLHADEVTVGELLQDQGYSTMHIGKWHLGDHHDFLPHRHGFDNWYGLPYSNDMWPYHPKMPPTPGEDARMQAARARAAMTGYAGQESYYRPGAGFPQPLPLMRNDTVLETNPDQTKLTTSYTEEALKFIREKKDGPFFLYLAHAMPHVPLFVSDEYDGRSKRGLYGDVMMEIDWSTGQILQCLKDQGIDENTLVVFTSDNGPWLQYGIDGGSAGPLRDGKGSAFEGGMRVPAVMRWPGHIPARSRTSEIAANMDLLPTFAGLAGAELPSDRTLDGRDLWPLMSGERDATSPHETFYYYGGSNPRAGGQANLRAVRQGSWKLFFTKDREGQLKAGELYDLHADVSETEDRGAEHAGLVKRLTAMAQEFNDDLIANIRPVGSVADNE